MEWGVMRAATPMGCYDCVRVVESRESSWFFLLSTVLIIKGVRESTLSVGKSVLIKVVLIKVKIKKKKPTQLSTTLTQS